MGAKKKEERLKELFINRMVEITREELVGMIRTIDEFNGNSITIDLLEFEEQVKLFAIPPENPQ